jgi:diguanylate cyclase (GGDEF)-like protein/PAS domain S-box-containing protein
MELKYAPHKHFLMGRWSFWAVAITTILSIGVSVYCLNAGLFIVFQNILYMPMIIACAVYSKRGFIFSAGLAVSYYLLMHGYTHDPDVLNQAQARTVIFIAIAGVVAHLTSVRERAEKALRIVIGNVPTAIFRGYVDWSLDPLNEEIEHLTGYLVSDFTSGAVKWSDLIHPQDLGPAKVVVVESLRSGALDYTREYRILCRSGEEKWIRERSCIILDQDKRIENIVGVFHDVTADITKREKNEFLASRDPLTGLFNRLNMEDSFKRELNRAQRKAESIGVIVLDIDHFKTYNDTYGHLAGDAVLRALGGLLMGFSRRYDISCRFGGEEFIIILPDIELEVVRRRAEKLRVEVKQLKLEDNGNILSPVNISLGVACFPQHGATSTELIRAADAALYRAKQGGRDQVAVAEINPK